MAANAVLPCAIVASAKTSLRCIERLLLRTRKSRPTGIFSPRWPRRGARSGTSVNPRTGAKRIDEAFPEHLRKRTADQEMLIEFRNGSTWQVLGSDNYDSLVGAAPYGITLSEWALANPAAWAYLRPILAENDGWAFWIYTARGRNHGLTTLTAEPN